ncbi:hydroquinone glucosyltransferase [Cicer arietinum]
MNMNMNMNTNFHGEPIHIAVVSGVGYSHLVPILHFSNILVNLHPYIHVTCLIPSLGSPPNSSKSILQTLPSNINYTFLPPVHPNDLPQGLPLEMQIEHTVTHSLPSIHKALKSLTLRTPFVAMIADSFVVEALEFAKEFNMLSYIYYPASATTLSLNLYLPKLDAETSCEYKDIQKPIQIPGCIPLHGRDLSTTIQDRSSQLYKFKLQRVKKFHFVDGIFVNSFLEMEMGPIKTLTQEGSGNPVVYPVGPIIQQDTQHGNNIECSAWLDKQKPRSVLFVSFGSGGTLSQEQIFELALGLELSNHKFLWVVRAPSSRSKSAAYLSAQNDGIDPSEFLPYGFLERTKEKGLVITSWAPQIQILSHSSVGGFLSHCGWNSTLESAMHGVPLITWPLFAEQRMNAVLLNEGLKVGLRPKVNENGIVEKIEVAEVIKCFMKDEKLRNNMKKLKEAATNALKENGSSIKILSQLTLKWRNLAKETNFKECFTEIVVF